MSIPVFSVIAISNYADKSARVELKPTQDNLDFWDTDPNAKAKGRIELTVTNPDTIKLFEVGKNYYVSFSLKPT